MASNTIIDLIQKAQCKVLRTITGAPLYIRNEIIHRDLEVPLVKEEFKKDVIPRLCLSLAVILWNCHFILASRDYYEDNINICENVADHIFLQDIKDCTKYFVCVYGQAQPQQCKAGLYFDASQQACIASRQGCLNCPPRQMLNVPLIKTCDKYISCYYGHGLLRKCENQQQFNVKTGKCDLAKNVDCVDNHCSIHTTDSELVYVPSAASCGNYYICMAGQPKSLTCAPGLYFSTECNCCDRAENVQCLIEDIESPMANNKEKRYFNKQTQQLNPPTLVGETTAVKCPPNGHFIYQYIEDPEYYVTCINGKAALYACAAGYHFDDRQKRCVNNEKLEQYTTDSWDFNNTESNLPQCPEFGAAFRPHAEHNKYILCVNGNATIFECPEDQYFDANENVCRNSSEELRKNRYGSMIEEFAGIVCPKFATFTFPHVEKHKFYLCLDGKANVFACAEGQFFDSSLHDCRDELIEVEEEFNANVTLSADKFANQFNVNCPATGNTTLPHVQKNQYYLCIEGNSAVFACAEGLFYDNKLKNCTNTLRYNELYKPEETANIMCPKFGTFKFPHVNKTQYYLCTDGKTYVLACDLNEIFDEDINICRINQTLLLEMQDNSTSKGNTTQRLTAVITEFASNIICPKFGTFMYPHVQRNRYYVCIDGNAIGFACADGHFFDTKTNACQRDMEVDIGNNESDMPVVLDEPINILCPSLGAMKFAHEQENKFYLCVNGMASVLACANGSFFDAESGACLRTLNATLEISTVAPTANVTNTTIVKCPLLGTFIYPHAETNQYYVCLEGKAIVLTCPEGLVFDLREKACRNPLPTEDNENQTPMVLDEVVSIMCPAAGAYKFPHIENSKFYLCINGMGSVLACANGTIFDKESGTCQRQEAFMQNSTRLANGNETSLQNSTLAIVSLNNTADISNITCPAFGTFLYPHEDQHRYFLCLDGNAIEFTCAKGFIFDTKSNVCTKDLTELNYNNITCPPQGTAIMPHVEKHNFYLCINGTARIQSCANGELFDAETNICRKTSTIQNMLYEPLNSICPAQGLFKLPHVNRNKYYLCIDGIATIYSCAKGDFFDAETETCRETLSLKKGIYKTPTIPFKNVDYHTDAEENALTESVSNMCPPQGTAMIPHIDSNKFYVCINGRATINSCPKGGFFDAELETCRERLSIDNGIYQIPSLPIKSVEYQISPEEDALTEYVSKMCPPQGTSMIPHIDSKKFYKCIDGLATIQSCAAGDFFDAESETCRETNSVDNGIFQTHPEEDALIESVSKMCPPQGTSMIPHIDSKKFYKCIDGLATIQSCAAGDFFDAESETCRETNSVDNGIYQIPSLPMKNVEYQISPEENALTESVSKLCPPQGTAMIPHIDSNKFYKCIDGIATIQSCASGDFFDSEIKTCREALHIESEQHQTLPENRLTETQCPPQGTKLMPHIDNNKFYLCIDGVATIQSCASGDFFDVETKTCRETNTIPNMLNAPINNICPIKGTLKLPHENPNKFYLCINGIATTHSCAKGDIFDQETQTCSELVFMSNELHQSSSLENAVTESVDIKCPQQGTAKIPHIDKNKFYQCINGIATIQSCLEGDFFDAETKTCRVTSYAEHISITCPEFGTFVYPLRQKNTFYVCHEGKARAVFCADGDVFDAETNACREIQNVPTEGLLVNLVENQENPGLTGTEGNDKANDKTKQDNESEENVEETSKLILEENKSETENKEFIKSDNNVDNSEKNPFPDHQLEENNSETENILLDNTNKEFIVEAAIQSNEKESNHL
ncbi:uncharacterized protein LOC135955742 [Calliphora vicina]|uniref:uncharacterized protein LOC135955742 n=1 Tax=Calliphora vicina TaxID=7373 RepID=UPI00325B560E